MPRTCFPGHTGPSTSDFHSPASGTGGSLCSLRSVAGPLGTLLLALFLSLFPSQAGHSATVSEELVLRIHDWKSGKVFVEVPAQVNSRLFFGWIHSLEKIPWNEYFHVAEDHTLVLDAITFPAFGAGIPEDKGRVCYVQDGLIHMEGIDQVFTELVWLNSHTATREILLDGAYVTQGSALPQHTRLRLVIETR